MELLTTDVTTLGDGRGTRYRAELNVKLPGLDNMTPEDVKKTIDTVIADPAAAPAVESKTVKLGMSPDEVKKSLGNPDKIVDLGAKQVYVYKDMKIVFLNSQVSDASGDSGVESTSATVAKKSNQHKSYSDEHDADSREPYVRPWK